MRPSVLYALTSPVLWKHVQHKTIKPETVRFFVLTIFGLLIEPVERVL